MTGKRTGRRAEHPLTDYVDLVRQWRGDRSISDPSIRRRDVVEWECDFGHRWTARIADRIHSGSGCLVCSGKLIVPGVNDLATRYPDLVVEWHPGNFTTPSTVAPGSKTRRLWQCSIGHTWWTAPLNRTTGHTDCPTCANRIISTGFNDLATTHPYLALELHSTSPLLLEEVTAGSERELVWVCVLGHIWDASPVTRLGGSHRGCPYCSGKRVLVGFNDFATTHPHLVDEWSDTNELAPTDVSAGSAKRVTWRCRRGHTSRSSVAARTRPESRGCAICQGRAVLAGFNDLATVRPDIAAQWHPENTEQPTQFTAGSGHNVLWQCANAPSHSWRAGISDRTRRLPSNCPHCAANAKSSKFEDDIADFVTGLLPGEQITRNERLLIHRHWEFDIAVPNRHLSIECNGVYWHSQQAGKGSAYHAKKRAAALAAGYVLIQVWEDDWKLRRPIVEASIAHKLGASTQKTVPARCTSVMDIGAESARAFCDSNHLRGSAEGDFSTGLQSAEEELVAVAIWRLQGTALHLTRFCTSAVIPGGLGKLVAHAERSIAGWETMSATVDLQSETGSVFERLGWARSEPARADYSIFARGQRAPRSEYPISRFRNDPKLEYREGATERELADLNGLNIIWDSGSVTFERLRAPKT